MKKINNIFGTGTMRSGGSLTSQIFFIKWKSPNVYGNILLFSPYF